MGRGLFEGWHLVILLVVVMLLFGAKRLPDSARSLGRSLRIFKAEMKDMGEDGKTATPEPRVPPVIEGVPLDRTTGEPVRPAVREDRSGTDGRTTDRGL